MTNEQQWIPLTGPGGRLPTIDDASDKDQVYVYDDRSKTKDTFYRVSATKGWTHWAPIPKAPPLPKPVELSQEEKDEAKALALFREWRSSAKDIETCMVECIRYGRSDGRAQLAREALGLFNKCSTMPDIADDLNGIELNRSAEAIRHLHELLTKAAEEKP